MITNARQPGGDETDMLEPVAMSPEQVTDPFDRMAGVHEQPDVYATAELLRRHKRTESIIRKAREQFS